MSLSIEVEAYFEEAQRALKQSRDIFKLSYYDVAISRAYYAMFYATQALLASKNISAKKHSGVRSCFAQYFVKPGLIEATYSRMLSNAFNLRLDSNYQISISHSKDEAEDVLNEAKQFVQRIKTYLQNEGFINDKN